MFFKRVIPGYPDVCMLKIAYFWLLNAQIALTAIWISTWKLYFHQRRRPGLQVAVRGTGSASAPSPSGGVRCSSAGLAPFSPVAGAGAAGASGGAGGAWAGLLNSSPLLTASYRVGPNEALTHSPSPQCRHKSPAFGKNRCKIRLL